MITNDSRKELFHGSLGLLTSAFHLLAREVAVTYLRPWRVPRRLNVGGTARLRHYARR